MKDFYSDFGHNYIKMFQNREVPSFVKEAESMEVSQIEALPDSAFACVNSRTLPITSPSNVYISAAYYYGANEKSAQVEDRILKAARLFNIEDSVTELAKSISVGATKVASQEESNSWEISINDKTQMVFEGGGPESLGKFASYFVETLFNSLEFGEKVNCAKNIAQKMAHYDMEIPSRICEVAGINIPNTEKVAQQIKARAIRIPDDKNKVALCKIADDFLDSTDKSVGEMFKVAQLLDILDTKYSLRRFPSVQDPFASVFNTSRETATKLASVVELGDGSYSYEELLSIPTSILKVALSEDSAKLVGVGTENYDPSLLSNLTESERSILASYL